MTDKDYAAALHGIQSGVAYEIETLGLEDAGASPKHLRVGVNSALVSNAALVRLLIQKGIITLDEYQEALTAEAERECERFERKHFPEGAVKFR